MSGDAEIRGHAAALVADVAHTVGRRFAAVAVLAVVAAMAEGVGLMLLVPLLDLLGVTGSGITGSGVTSSAGAGVAASDGAGGVATALRALGRHLDLGEALLLYVLLVAAAGAVVWARSVAATALQSDYVEALRLRLHRAVLAMGWPALGARRQADLTHAMIAEVGQCSFAVQQLLQMLASLMQLPALLLGALLLSPGFTAGVLLLAFGLTLALRPLNRRAFALGGLLADSQRALNAELADQIAGLRLIKGFGVEEARAACVHGLATRARGRQLDQAWASATARMVQRSAAAAAAALALWVGLARMGLALSDLLVLLALFARLMGAALRVQECWRIILLQLPIHARLMEELADWRRAAEPPPAGAPPVLARAIALRGVGYGYADAERGGQGAQGARAALAGLDAEIPAFATTAVVGPSGAGKSTLADIVMGLVPPDVGRLEIDGRPLDGPARAAWRRRVGYVPQDPFLFHATVRENLLLAQPEAEEAELWWALEGATVDGVVRALPRGLDTVVGDRGSRLSGGERQRLALARALLRRPDLLVLDEATASLDAETESLVAGSLRRLQGRLTLLVVAHRPSTVRGADHVLVLEGGRLLAAGDWPAVRAAVGDRLTALDMMDGAAG